MAQTIYKPVSYSRIVFTELMFPNNANFENKIHGGVLIALMDKVALACATKHAGSYCVTASVDQVDFFRPVEVGDLVRLYASVNYVGNASMVVGLRGEAENIKTGSVKHITTSYFTMVAKDDRGRPKQVPGLILETTTDIRRFMEAMIRKDFKLQSKVRYEQKVAELNIFESLEQLKRERCEIGFDID